MAKPGQSKFDPRQSERQGITPGFLNQNGKNDRTPITGSEKDSTNQPQSGKQGSAGVEKDAGDPHSAAEEGLAGAEKNAIDSPITDADDLDDISMDESSPVRSFLNNTLDNIMQTNRIARLASRRLSGKGPVATVILLILGVFGLMVSSQSLMPFSLLEQLRDKFDGINISNQTRTKTILRKQLKRNNIKGATTKKILGGGKEVYSLSKNQKTKLASEGIELKDIEIDGETRSVLIFDDGSGARKLVAADDADVGWLKKLGNGIADIDIEGNKMKVDLDEITTFDVRYTSDTDFMNGYNKSSRTWRGSIGAWFDSKTAKFLDRFVITRSIFKNFIERVQGEEAGNTRSRVSSTINNSGKQNASQAFDDLNYDEKERTAKPGEVDSDGNQKYEWTDNGKKRMEKVTDLDPDDVTTDLEKELKKTEVTAKTHGNSKQEVENMKTKLTDSISKKVTGAMNLISNSACMILTVVGSGMLMATAQEAVQLLKVGTSFLEAVDKTRAGDGEAAPIHTIGNAMTAKTDTIIETDNGSEVIRKDMSAMQSNGISSLYTGLAMNPSDKSVNMFTFGSTLNSIFGKLNVGLSSFRACATVKMAGAIVDAVFDLAEIVAAVFTGGVGALLAEIGKSWLVGAGASILVQKAVGAVVQFLVPKIASWFIRDLVTDLAGENYGNAILAGANRYMSSNFRFGGGSLASMGKYLEFRAQQERILAEQAEYERRTKSPFDVTSQNTFLGSIVKQLITLSTLSNGPTNLVSGLSSMVNTSILALIPSASAADDIAKDMINENDFEKNCPYLAQIGAYGDAYCNPYIITDMSTINSDPGDIEENSYIKRSFEGDKIKSDSNLAKYITYCGNRTSEFGIVDNNIASEIGSSAFLNTGDDTADASIGALPVIGDIADFFSNKEQLKEMGWISGQNCVTRTTEEDADEDAKRAGVISWSENKIYQRYVEDQRLYESIQPDYKSPVTAFLDEYYEEHPLDNSYEGVLARFSGLTKDQVVATLDVVDYLKYIAEYDPSERYAFGVEFVEQIKSINLHSEADNSVSLLQHNIVYADVRNRAFAMA